MFHSQARLLPLLLAPRALGGSAIATDTGSETFAAPATTEWQPEPKHFACIAWGTERAFNRSATFLSSVMVAPGSDTLTVQRFWLQMGSYEVEFENYIKAYHGSISPNQGAKCWGSEKKAEVYKQIKEWTQGPNKPPIVEVAWRPQ